MRRFLKDVAAAAALLVVSACAPQGVAPSTAEPLGESTTIPSMAPSPFPTSPLQHSEVKASPEASDRVADFPDPRAYRWAPVADGLSSPVDIQFPEDGTGRMFVVEQTGRIQVVDSAAGSPSLFLDIEDRVESGGNEQGLLGLAFHPRFLENGLFFVNYTDRSQHNVISRFQLSADRYAADPASETIVLSVDDPYPNHNGGVLAFGPEGYLYAGMGDGGSANDPLGNGQNTESLLGKILRIDVDGGSPYAIPPENPFAAGGGRPEVWAYGLRNPWRMAFDRATGDLYIGDVGQGSWEEVDLVAADSAGGINFGWNYREGAHRFASGPASRTDLVDPVAEYSHAEGGCSITGGYVYRGLMPQWAGVYLYGDFCTGKIWGLLPAAAATAPGVWTSSLLFESGAQITTFGQDTAGEVYYADRRGGIYRLELLP